MRQTILLTVALAALALMPGGAAADASRCSEAFPDVDWTTASTEGPTSVATAGMTEAVAARFAADVDRVAQRVQADIGGLDDSIACLATPELAEAFTDLAARGQRLHAAVLGEERVFVISAVETRMIDDAIAFGIPHLALWSIADDLGLEQGYPEPLGSTIAHWYLADDNGRLAQYRSQLTLAIFLDDTTPEDRTLDDAMAWVADAKPDPFRFDPQLIGSQMGVFVEYAVGEEGASILRETDQATWAELENRWRIAIRDEYPRRSPGVWWGVGIVVVVTLLAIVLAWLKRIEKKRLARRFPTPPADESMFPTEAQTEAQTQG